MAVEKKIHSVKATGANLAEAVENASNEIQASEDFAGELSARPVKGSVEEIKAPVKEKITLVANEDKPEFTKAYMVDGEACESLADAKARAKELAMERQTDVEIRLEYQMASEDNLIATVEYQAAEDGEWSFDMTEKVEVEDEDADETADVEDEAEVAAE